MYVHVGGDYLVRAENIIGIFDIDNTSISKITREFFKTSEKNSNVINVSMDLPRSFILENNNTVYISPISASTLQKRINAGSFTQKERNLKI